jgi:parallel beta-helix repeat protein
VARGSSARILGNTIVNNKGSGIFAHRSSQADVFGNSISGNAENGITARYGAGINLRVEAVPANSKLGTNRTDANSMNAGVGLSCSIGGYADGPMGTLDGAKGAKELDRTCIDRLTQP